MHFDSDYTNTCHPLILQRMAQTEGQSLPGYGTDAITRSASDKIRRHCECPDADVYFLGGGTQTNMVVIDYLLRSFEGVLAADTGHIAIHESGAVEFTGHKVLTLPPSDGKLTAKQVDDYVTTYYADPNWEHIVPPGMVYITHPTEYGTLYSLSELEEISAVCHKHGIPLYLDGARLGYALAAEPAGADRFPTLPDIARLCDAFYIGGTKCGAMFGEAVVFPNIKTWSPRGENRFFSHIKRHGALLAKGWIAALQFDTLLEGDTLTSTPYFTICRHAVSEAMRLRQALVSKGYELPVDSPTNQQFVRVTLDHAAELKQHITYGDWEPPCGNSVTIRLATSWATQPDDVDRLIQLL
ncbi:MAG: low specificity L-threonine aldolase [Bacteroidaceae bacterium]|nr:low specificity L-threonine aldolase [Bacteroidaceae bacterium]